MLKLFLQIGTIPKSINTFPECNFHQLEIGNRDSRKLRVSKTETPGNGLQQGIEG